jgi:transposase
MRFYNRQHTYYCGIDLHVKTMYVCLVDGMGQVLVHRNVPSTPAAFLEVVAPDRSDLVVAAECMVTWYWLADVCAAEAITFVLGHALAMKAIHGGKAKNDKIDSHKIAVLLRGGMLPQAYVYPAAMRSTRDLIRRRLHRNTTSPSSGANSRTRPIARAWPSGSRTRVCRRASRSTSP